MNNKERAKQLRQMADEIEKLEEVSQPPNPESERAAQELEAALREELRKQ